MFSGLLSNSQVLYFKWPSVTFLDFFRDLAEISHSGAWSVRNCLSHEKVGLDYCTVLFVYLQDLILCYRFGVLSLRESYWVFNMVVSGSSPERQSLDYRMFKAELNIFNHCMFSWKYISWFYIWSCSMVFWVENITPTKTENMQATYLLMEY